MKKKKTKTSYAKKACELIQRYARLNETDDNGWGYCCSCNKALHFTDGQGGHFQPKGNHYNAACVDKRNVHFQCIQCNKWNQGNAAGYGHYMVSKYGTDILEEMFLLSKQLGTKEMMVEAIEKFKVLNTELEKGKVF